MKLVAIAESPNVYLEIGKIYEGELTPTMIGERVVCIKHFKSQGLQYELTYGKVYELLPLPGWSDGETYFIKCDRGFISSYHKNSFITLEEWRERQLNDIL